MFTGPLFIVTALTARAGIEVMGRMFIILLVVTLLLWISVLVLALPVYEPQLMLPLFPDGIRPLFAGTYWSFGFPYAEIVVMTMLFPHLRPQDRASVGKRLFAVLIANAVLMTLVVSCTIMALGPLAGELKYSLFPLSQTISIADFVERIEAMVGISLISGTLIKATIVLYALNQVVIRLFGLRDDRILLYPLAAAGFFYSLTAIHSPMEMSMIFAVVWPFSNILVYVVPLLLITAVTWLARKKRSLGDKEERITP